MKILWLLPVLPYPPDTGGKQDPYFMIRECSSLGDKITCGIIYHGDLPPDVPPEFAHLVQDVMFLPGNSQALTARLIASLSDDVPFKFRKYYSEPAVDQLTSLLLNDQTFDCIIIDHLHLTPLLLATIDNIKQKNSLIPPVILRSANVESTIVTKYAARMPNPIIKIFAVKESRKMRKYESEVLSKFNMVAAISDVDKTALDKLSKRRAKIITVTAGVDVESIKPAYTESKHGEVAFVGSFDWHPNVDGALWMVEKVWPRVLKSIPDAHFSIVGKRPPKELEKAASKSITVTGQVESVEGYIRPASCIAVPLWIGSGMRLKILEAFAYGKAVVSTSLGAEGIESKDGEHIIIQDDPNKFADSIIDVLSNKELREKLGRNARALAEERYSWSKVTSDLRSAILGMLSVTG